MTTNKPSIILVLGMHRSGTSLVAQLVAKWGAYMGDDLMPANEFNKDGYWEYIPLVNLNDKMLAYTGNSWYAPPLSVDVPLLMNVFGETARALVEKMDLFQITWCWKDPRMIILLPFWKKIFSDRRLLFIVSFRNPLSVATSINTRNNIPNALALSLWEFKMSILLNELSESDCIHYVNFDLLQEEPEANCLTLYKFLNKNTGVNSEPFRINEMVASIKPVLIHAKEQNEIFPENSHKELYQTLKSENPLADFHFKYERVNYLYQLLQMNKHTNIFIVQLFIACAEYHFNETDSIQTIFHEGVSEISFSLDDYHDIRELRFDPLNEWVSLKFLKMELYSGDVIIETLTRFESNALTTIDECLFFATNDPQLIFDLRQHKETRIDKVIIYIDYKLTGSDCKAFFAENLFLFPINNLKPSNAPHSLEFQNEELCKRLESDKQELVNKQSVIDKQERIIKNIEANNAQYQASILLLEQETKVKDIQIEESRRQIIDYAQQITQLTQLLDKIETSNIKISELNSELMHQLMLSENHVTEKDTRINELTDMVQVNEKTRLDMQQQIDKFVIENTNQADNIEKMQHESIVKDVEIEKLKNQLLQTHAKNECLDNELSTVLKSRPYQMALKARRALLLVSPKLTFSKIKKLINQNRLVWKIEKSDFFDREFYVKNNPDVANSKIKPAKHYLLSGGFEGRNPSERFSTILYLVYNPDVAKAGMNPLLHYILFGEKEGREIESARIDLNSSRKDLLIEAEKKLIEDSGMFDTEFYLSQYSDVLDSEMEALDHFVRHGWKEARSPNPSFDMNLYLINYNAQKEIINPLTHHIIFSELNKSRTLPNSNFELNKHVFIAAEDSEVCIAGIGSNENLNHPDYRFLKESSICWDDFFSFNKITSTHLDPVQYYINNWKRQNLIIPKTFDTKLYLTVYPDIATSGINPLVHFIKWGKKENRLGYFNINDHIVNGRLNYDPQKPTYVIACHESSATGAPLVGLNLCRELKSRYNIISLILRTDNLNDSFLESSFLQVQDFVQAPVFLVKEILKHIYAKYNFEVIICNSIGTFSILEAASQLKYPTVLLLHEFSLYTKPVGTISQAVISCDRIITPAQIIFDSALSELYEVYKCDLQPGNMIIAPQGKLPFIPESYGENLTPDELKKAINVKTDSTKIIIGAGYAQIRKGVDLFISVAEKIKRRYDGELRFVWVGDGYKPDDDFNYSLWLKIQIESSTIKDDFIFLDHQKNLDNILSIADCFLLTSRLDPFPNVVIDALYADTYVACFDGTTGCADFIKKHKANADVVPYLDVHEMAEKVLGYLSLTDAQKRPLKGLNRTIIEEHLGFNDYIEQIETEVNNAKKSVVKRVEIEKTIKDSKLFDSYFYRHYSGTENALDFYTKSSLKGIHISNPLPGFSERLWLHQTNGELHSVPLYEIVKNGDTPRTHNCIVLNGEKAKQNFKIAVHIHLYYIDLAEEFVKYLSNISFTFDLFITICDEEHLKEIEELFSMENIGKLEIIVVENIGRDIAPLLIDLKASILSGGYDIIGHFHSKKSESVSTDMGDRWRRYLLDNLMGDPNRINQMLNHFTEPTIGLIFAEDSYVVDMAANQKYADELCDQMNIPKVDDLFVFPLGTMFWAKPGALMPLFNCNFERFLQKEPLPYDGSFLHAVERLIPHCAKSCGFEYLTVYTKGTGW